MGVMLKKHGDGKSRVLVQRIKYHTRAAATPQHKIPPSGGRVGTGVYHVANIYYSLTFGDKLV